MVIKLALCDICGKEIKALDIHQDYDGTQRCNKCHLENKIRTLKSDLKSKEEWVNNVWIKKLEMMRNEIKKLEQILGENDE